MVYPARKTAKPYAVTSTNEKFKESMLNKVMISLVCLESGLLERLLDITAVLHSRSVPKGPMRGQKRGHMRGCISSIENSTPSFAVLGMVLLLQWNPIESTKGDTISSVPAKYFR